MSNQQHREVSEGDKSARDAKRAACASDRKMTLSDVGAVEFVDAKPRVIISFDVEATGSAPTTSSAVQLGFVVVRAGADPNPYSLDDWVLDQRQWCIQEYRPRDPQCWERFWVHNMEVWDYIQANAQPVRTVMEEFEQWYRELDKKYTIELVAKPAAYDFQWLNGLYAEFGPKDKIDIGFKATCLSSMIKTCELTGISSRVLSKFISSSQFKHTHMAIQDSLQQSFMYLKLCVWIRKYLRNTFAEKQS